MSVDSVLKQLAKLAREQQAAETPRDAAEARRVEELLAPPAPEAEARIVNMILPGFPASLASRRRTITGTGAQLERGRARSWWTISFAAPVLLAAAAWLFWVRGEGPAPLPAYAMNATGGISAYRSAERPTAEPLTLDVGSVLEIVLRPAVATEGPVDARLFWTRNGQEQRWEVVIERANGGAIRVKGTVDRPFGPGDGELVAVVGRPGDLPTRLKEAPAHASAWQLLRQPVKWR